MIGHRLQLLGALILAFASGLPGRLDAQSIHSIQVAQNGGSIADTPSLDTAERANDYRAGLEAFESRDFDQAYVLWKPLAENGYAVAQYSLAKLFERGGGAILKNPVEAALWYRQAAAKGVVAAQNNLAIMYAKGEGVPRLPAHAVSLWRKAAEGGHPMAQYNLALSYFNGNGVEVDRAMAATWFLGAGRAGVSEAQYALGQIYRQGLGVEQDQEQALYWYQQAGGQGHKAAREEATRLSDSGVVAQLPSADGGVLLALRGGEARDSPASGILTPEQSFQEVPAGTDRPAEPEPGAPPVQDDLKVPEQVLKEPGKDNEVQDVTEESSKGIEGEIAAVPIRPEPDAAESNGGVAGVEAPAVTANGLSPQPDSAQPLPRRKPRGARFQAPKALPRWALRIPPPPPKRNPLQASGPAVGTNGDKGGGDQPDGAETASIHDTPPYPPGSFSVWLLSTSKQSEAELYWRHTETSHPEVFAGLTPSVSAVTVDDLGSYYRLAAGPLPDQQAAKSLCRRLRVYRPDAFCKVESH